jgi:hypothetical protein
LKQVAILKFLVSAGADVHAKNNEGKMPIDVVPPNWDEKKQILREAMTR